MHVWSAVVLTSAGSRFNSPERFGAIVFSHSHTPTPTFIILYFTDLISLDGCLEWGLMAGLRGFAAMGAVFYLVLAGHGGGPWIPQTPTFHLIISEVAVNANHRRVKSWQGKQNNPHP